MPANDVNHLCNLEHAEVSVKIFKEWQQCFLKFFSVFFVLFNRSENGQSIYRRKCFACKSRKFYIERLWSIATTN